MSGFEKQLQNSKIIRGPNGMMVAVTLKPDEAERRRNEESKRRVREEAERKEREEKRRAQIMRQNSIATLSLRVQNEIISALSRNIPGSNWKVFAAEMEQILRENWLRTLYDEIEQSNNPSQTLFQCWATKDSFTVYNLVTILERMNYERLINLIRSDKAFL